MAWREQISNVLLDALQPAERDYLLESKKKIQADYRLHFVRIFSTLGRKLSSKSKNRTFNLKCQTDLPLIIENWSTIRLTRVWLLSFIEDEKTSYHAFIDQLFAYAELDELVALYSALNILHYPELWISRCEEGIRSNIGDVQQAIMELNRYPVRHLVTSAWNQLVLKSFFTEKDILKIVGLFERNNADLAHAIIDYIYERHSANRGIHPMLWLLSKDDLPPRAWDILYERKNEAQDQFEKALLERIWEEHHTTTAGQQPAKSSAGAFPLIAKDLLEKLKKEKICAQN